jgi:hypothetical protein
MKAIHAPRAAISAWFASAQLQSATIAEQPPELDSDNHLLKCRQRCYADQSLSANSSPVIY